MSIKEVFENIDGRKQESQNMLFDLLRIPNNIHEDVARDLSVSSSATNLS